MTLALLPAIVAISPRSLAQAPPEDVPAFRSDAQLALTGFHVVAKKQYIMGLSVSDFELLVDGQPRRITTFGSNQRKVSVEIVLVFDTSGSVRGRGLLDEKLFRDNFLGGLPGVTLSVYSFGGKPSGTLRRMTGPTQNPEALRRAFRAVVTKEPGEAAFDLGKPGKDSLIYESIVKALEDSSQSRLSAARLMLVVSDGLPGGEPDPGAAANLAQKMGVPIYPLVVGHQARKSEFEMQASMPPRQAESDRAFETRMTYRRRAFDGSEGQAARFASLGELTGGRSFDPLELNASTARDIVQFLAYEVRSEYVAGFSPEPGAPPVAHQIEIRLIGHKGARVIGGARVAVY